LSRHSGDDRSHAVTLSHAVKGTTLLIAGGAARSANTPSSSPSGRRARHRHRVSAEKAKFALEAGADHAIDYKRKMSASG